MDTDLPTDLILEILFVCDYRSILYLNSTCKPLNNINLETILINKSKRIKDIVGNIDHLIPLSIVYNKENLLLIIAYLKYLFDNNINFAYDDRILPDNRNSGCVGAIGFTGYKGIIATKHGIVIAPTYKIFQKFLQFKFY